VSEPVDGKRGFRSYLWDPALSLTAPYSTRSRQHRCARNCRIYQGTRVGRASRCRGRAIEVDPAIEKRSPCSLSTGSVMHVVLHLKESLGQRVSLCRRPAVLLQLMTMFYHSGAGCVRKRARPYGTLCGWSRARACHHRL
jgi:hypothetical protein